MMPGWCTFEEAVSLEFLGRAAKIGGAMRAKIVDEQQRAKCYDVGSLPPTVVEREAPQDARAVSAAIDAAAFTGVTSASRALVASGSTRRRARRTSRTVRAPVAGRAPRRRRGVAATACSRARAPRLGFEAFAREERLGVQPRRVAAGRRGSERGSSRGPQRGSSWRRAQRVGRRDERRRDIPPQGGHARFGGTLLPSFTRVSLAFARNGSRAERYGACMTFCTKPRGLRRERLYNELCFFGGLTHSSLFL